MIYIYIIIYIYLYYMCVFLFCFVHHQSCCLNFRCTIRHPMMVALPIMALPCIAPFLSLEVLVKSCQINIPIDSYYSTISCPQVSLFHVHKVVKPNKKLGLGLVVLIMNLLHWNHWMNLIGLSCFIPAPVPLAGPPWKMRRKRRLGPARTFPLGGAEPHRKGGRCQMATNTSGGRREGQLQYNLQYIESNTMELKNMQNPNHEGSRSWLVSPQNNSRPQVRNWFSSSQTFSEHFMLPDLQFCGGLWLSRCSHFQADLQVTVLAVPHQLDLCSV